MTEPQSPPPPPGGSQGAGAPATQKKGLSPLAWVGIGCGALVVIGLIGMAILFAMGVSWLGGKAQEFEENPAMASAKMVVRANPELELVEADEEAGTLTVRNRQTGEVTTVGLDEVEEGRITFESDDGEEVSVGFEEDAEGGGALTVRDKEGRATFRAGSGGETEIPGWVPRYRGVAIEGTYYAQSDGEVNGGFSFKSEDAVDEVVAWYEDSLEDVGFEITGRSSYEAGGVRGVNLSAEADGRTVNLMATTEGEATQGVVSFSGPAGQ